MRVTAVAVTESVLSRVMAVGLSEDARTILLNVRVRVLLVRSKVKSTSSGGMLSCTKLMLTMALLGGTTTATFSAMSLMNPYLSEIQQLVISEQSLRSSWSIRRSGVESSNVTMVLFPDRMVPPVRVYLSAGLR